jgi:hypothetical protein
VWTKGERLILDPIVHIATTIFHKLTEKHFTIRCEMLTGVKVHGLVPWVMALCSPASGSVSGKYHASIFCVRMSTAMYSAAHQLRAKGICCFVVMCKSLYYYFNGKHPIVL